MTKISEVPHLPLEALRPIVQRALQLDEWPGDWSAAGMIIERHPTDFYRVILTGHHSALVWGDGVNASGHDSNPLVAIFRAYILMRTKQIEWDKQKMPRS